jgi:hypothetical protein
MTLNLAIAAAERTETARHLIAQAQVDNVDLVLVSALELCTLDGLQQPVFDERVARAWLQITDRRRREVMEQVTTGLLRRGLLIDDRPERGAGHDGSTYSLKPELGLMLAARCRPAFVVIAKGDRQDLRPLSLFALGDQADPVQAIVAELPAGLPPDRNAKFRDTRKLGPLGWIYRYVLVSMANAADLLAKWTITQPVQPGNAAPVRYLVSAYRPDREKPIEHHLGVCGDGSRAFVDEPGSGNGELARAEYDLEGLRALMLNLLSEVSR